MIQIFKSEGSLLESLKAKLLVFLGLSSVIGSLGLLSILIVKVFLDSAGAWNLDFLLGFPSRFPEKAGIYSALLGTLWVMGFTALISIPLGVMSGVYLEEFASEGKWKRLVSMNISNLAGVPSVVYGMLGLAVFVRGLDLGRSVLAGSLTMSLLILPIIVIATCEALKAVPQSLRLAGLGLGGTRSQVVFHHVLPEALPGICTGVILALSRAIGESAPLILIGALSFVAFVPETPMDSFTVLAIQIFNWAGRPQEAFQARAAGGIIVLLTVTLMLNAVAIFIRTRISQREKRGGF